jgi:Uncharacterised nucleotidyltransferase
MEAVMQPVRVDAVVNPAAARGASWKEVLLACQAQRQADPPAIAHREALLAYLAPGASRPDARAVLEALTPEEWSALSEYALGPWTRMGSLVFTVLRDAGLEDRVPPGDLERYRAQYARSSGQIVQRRADLAAVLGRLRAEGLPAAVLKGPYMVEHVYADPAARKMSDIDLFVPREALAGVERAVLGMGYGPDAAWRPSVEWSLAVSPSLRPLEKAGATVVSVHWNIEDPRSPFPIDVDALWARTQVVTLAGEETRILGTEDYLLHLCLHAAYRHGFETPMRCYYDLALMLDHWRGRVDWDVLAARAAEWKAARLCFVALDITRRLFSAQIPAEAMDRLAENPLDRHVGRVATEHTVRAASAQSPEWGVTRRVLSAWLRDVTGAWPRPEW